MGQIHVILPNALSVLADSRAWDYGQHGSCFLPHTRWLIFFVFLLSMSGIIAWMHIVDYKHSVEHNCGDLDENLQRPELVGFIGKTNRESWLAPRRPEAATNILGQAAGCNQACDMSFAGTD